LTAHPCRRIFIAQEAGLSETETDKQGLLVAALAKAKLSIKAPKKGRTANAGKYSYNYADRADVIESYQKPLSDNGLAIIHTVILGENMHMILCSRLVHSGGGEITSSIPIPHCDDAQVLGSWLSYLERYQSSALVDIAAEDDSDGQLAKAPERKQAAAEPDPNMPLFSLRSAIKAMAEEIAQEGGGLWPEIVREASSFTVDGGKVKSFSDPFVASLSEKWLRGVHGKLAAKLPEPGAAEAAAAFTDTKEVTTAQ
jgi:hypothetical protein